MHGVSEVIAIILILMITISLAGLAYMFMSTTMSDVTSSAGSTVDTTTSSMLTSFTIESMDIAKVYIRNTGQNTLTSLSVYVNDEPATFNVTTPIAAGSVGTVTIYSFIPDGATVKVTSPSGFSTSKVADECSKAVGCWKFDETSGTVAYDSSPYGNTGTLVNGTVWASGKSGNGLQFDGVNDYVTVPAFNHIQGLNTASWSVLFYPKSTGSDSYGRFLYGVTIFDMFVNNNANDLKIILYNTTLGYSNPVIQDCYVMNQWNYFVTVLNSTHLISYCNGVEKEVNTWAGGVLSASGNTLYFGKASASSYFNGTIDEVRIYDRAIY